ncbi:transporter [Nonlabens sp. MB-3u-79]|mgnify:CR=1 FL=1|jgi:outer membrane protein|uniref:TolC family protein n=1 Tax=Nonlabens sp. MB-3u-79 TaxID=2058134 RepID=UPI000C31905E|nr:TolC family protein [Nonlabens sp. MB-3u-79]AUC78556.1 transporter [Nonlabens sp. MB-3u-79]|tara:strand:- start:6976 stop:8301 length:1326 start_codon:yes stop_codon:yes gene_type:complete
MKKLIICSIVLFSFAFAKAQQNNGWTLQECIQQAIDKNISIKNGELDKEVAVVEKRDALGNFLPSLNLSARRTVSQGFQFNPVSGFQNNKRTNLSGGASSGVTIFDGLRSFRQYKRANLSAEAADYRLQNLIDNTAVNVANTFLNVLFNRENLQVLLKQHEVTNSQIKQTQNLVEAGSLPRGDLLEIQATYESENQQIITAQNSLTISKLNLAQLLMIEDYENFDVAEVDYSVPVTTILDNEVDQVVNNALDTRSEIKIAEINKKLSTQDLLIARSGYSPTVTGFLNYNTNAQEDTDLAIIDQLYLLDGISYGISLNVPVFNGFSTRNQVDRAKINLERANIAEQQAKLDLEALVYRAYTDAEGSKVAYASALKTLEARRTAFEYSQERYNVGLLNAFDFEQSRQQVVSAANQVIQSKYQYIFNLKVLELYFGIPVNELRL